MDAYDPKAIEEKWQAKWLKEKTFEADQKSNKPKKYILDMFPYPSGDGLHVGHAKIYTGSDVVSRYWRLQGYEVLHPTGFDAFGLPTENSAIKLGIHPQVLTRRNIDRFRKQMQRLGFSYDWSREVDTSDPAYYRWTQWIFLQLFKKGLAYQDTVPINWCPSCLTGLANEEVIDGKCERCGTTVELRPMKQWLLRITQYADRLLKGLEKLDWPAFIVELQRNWIGESHGWKAIFDAAGQPIAIFTTRLDTIFGATYLVLSPEHPAVGAVTTPEYAEGVAQYQKEASRKSALERTDLNKEKSGVFTGGYATNPATNQQIPIWIADYVLPSYGTGAIMAVPAHDARDYEFAKQYDLPIVTVIAPEASDKQTADALYEGEGVLVDSGEFSGTESDTAREAIGVFLSEHKQAERVVFYKLRDWVFSRQRYWGEPIPIIHCPTCGAVPVPEKDLPVELPAVERYQPTGTGESPLAAIEEWVAVPCPVCGEKARRETNTMPQWAGSSWYWLRYPDPRNAAHVADKQALGRWLPVDVYIGGAEHAVLHLLYARFWNMVLCDAGVAPQEEPFPVLRNVGLVMGEDGVKMSKSRGNVINPDEVIEQHGADTLRVYEMFMGPFDQAAQWSQEGIEGSARFLRRVWQLSRRVQEEVKKEDLIQQQTIKRVTIAIETLRFNTGIAALMEWLNALEKAERIPRAQLKIFVVLLSPFAPHVAAELWERMGEKNSLYEAGWPHVDEALLAQAPVQLPVQVNGRLRGTLTLAPGTTQAEVEAAARALPNVQRHVAQKKLIKVVFVPGRLLNFVVQ
jgi:leucyl-tRNA synthetase